MTEHVIHRDRKQATDTVFEGSRHGTWCQRLPGSCYKYVQRKTWKKTDIKPSVFCNHNGVELEYV